MEKKRQRAPNFTVPETMLLYLLEKYKHVVENKKTDGVSIQEKALAWAKFAREYNATTKGTSRTAENLKQAVLNLKKRVKKEHSSEKMMIPVSNNAPSTSHTAINKENLVHIIEECGTDWNIVSKNVGASEQDCQNIYEVLVKEAKKDSTNIKKHIMLTGGGPPDNSEDPILERVKGIMGPEVDGFHSKYDGDSIMGEEFIEDNEKKENLSDSEEQHGKKRKFFDCNRKNLKTKKDKSFVTSIDPDGS